jgi:hypothetical protein
VILVSPHQPNKVLEILEREIDRPPSLLRSLLTLNAHYYAGDAPVCGKVHAYGFELRNRKGPAFSLRAIGKLNVVSDGTEIEVTFTSPTLPDPVGWLFRRSERDRSTIVRFLKQRLQATERAHEGSAQE